MALPTTPTFSCANNNDGTATVTISGSDAGTTNSVYKLPKWGDAFAWSLFDSRVGDGALTLTGVGDYILIIISDDGAEYSFPSNPRALSITNGRRTCIRDALARAEYEAVKQSPYGLQVAFTNGLRSGNDAVNILVSIQDANIITQLKNSSMTDVESVTFHAPRQTGFPPAEVLPGSYLVYGTWTFEIDRIIASNGFNELSATFEIHSSRYRQGGNY